MVLLSLSLIFLFASFSLGELGRIGLGNAISAGVIDLSIAFLALVWFLKYRKGHYVLLKPIALFAFAALLSLVLNIKNYPQNQLLVSSMYLIRWILYSSLYFVFADIGKKLNKKITKYMVFSGFVILLIGLAQFVLYPSLRDLYYLGWDEHLYRLFSVFLDPNFAGVILVLYFIFVFIKRNELFTNKALSYIILILTFLGIVLTYSRGALLMFIVSAVTYAVINKNWKIIGLTIALFIGLFIVLSPRFYLENTNLLRTVSTKERLETAGSAIRVWQKNPLGVGFDTYRYARQKYGEKDLSLFGPSHSGAGVDNSFIFVLVTAGIEGLLAYLFLLWRMFGLGFAKIKTNKWGMILVLSSAGLIINSLTINSIFYSFIMVWIWIIAGLTESSLRE